MDRTTAATAASKRAHTPGPWVTADGHGPIKDGTSVQSTHDGWLVCSCTGYYGREGARANARLIAAAPDMLIALREAEAALEVAVGRLQKGQPDYPIHVTSEYLGLVIVRSAIAQATGSAA